MATWLRPQLAHSATMAAAATASSGRPVARFTVGPSIAAAMGAGAGDFDNRHRRPEAGLARGGGEQLRYGGGRGFTHRRADIRDQERLRVGDRVGVATGLVIIGHWKNRGHDALLLLIAASTN